MSTENEATTNEDELGPIFPIRLPCGHDVKVTRSIEKNPPSTLWCRYCRQRVRVR
jgi:hypothetical protein